MEGKVFSARNARVRLDDAGLDVHSRERGGVRLPWAVIVDVRESPPYRPNALRSLTVHLVDGSTLTLLGGPRHAARFEARAREITEAYHAHRAAPAADESGAPQDEMPFEYRLDETRRIDEYAGPSRLLAFLRPWRLVVLAFAGSWRTVLREFVRPWSIVLLACIAGGLVGLGGSIHAYARDLPAYNAYRSASPCNAASVGDGHGSAYCVVTDGVADESMNVPAQAALHELTMGPDEPFADLSMLSDAPTVPEVAAYFDNDQPPALDDLVLDDPVEYVASNDGTVASVTVQGVTYQTLNSPQARNVYDWASIFAAASIALLFASLLGLKAARRRLPGPWALLPFSLIAALMTNLTVVSDQTTSRPPSSAWSLLGLNGLVAACAAAALTALWWLVLRRLARRPVSRLYRVLP